MEEVFKLKDVDEMLPKHNGTSTYLEPRAAADSGQARLHALGYRQELRRVFGPVTSFSTSLVLMAVTAPITGMEEGGAHIWLLLVCQLERTLLQCHGNRSVALIGVLEGLVGSLCRFSVHSILEWRPSVCDLGLASLFRHQCAGSTVYGGDCVGIPDCRRTLLLVRIAMCPHTTEGIALRLAIRTATAWQPAAYHCQAVKVPPVLASQGAGAHKE